MNSLPLRIILVTAVIIAQPALHAQNQNPITAAREEFRKALEDAKRQAQGQGTSPPAQAGTDQPAQPAPGATQSGSRSPAAAPRPSSVRQTGDVPGAAGSAQETARLAAALSYIDVAGVKLGTPLAEAQKVLTATNPAFRFTPQIETPWPLRGGQPPPNAPKSVLNLRAELGTGGRDGSESFEFQAAVHPNPPVVVKIFRSMNFPGNGGPSFDNLVASLRKKYGPESTANPTANPNPTLAAIQDKYGAPQFQHAAPAQAHWTWATGVAGRPAPGSSPCSGAYSPVETLVLSLVTSNFIEPRVYFNAPDCGVALNAVLKHTNGLVFTIGTSLVDNPAGVRAREELEVMGRRPDSRVTEAEHRGKPRL